MKQYSYYRNAAWLERKRVAEGLSLRQIAEEVGCSRSTVLNWLKKFGISRFSQEDDKFTEEMLDIIQIFEGRLTTEDRKAYIKVIEDIRTEIEEKRNEEPGEPELAGRIVHKPAHPSDYARIGMDSKDNPRNYGNTLAEELSLIEEIDG